MVEAARGAGLGDEAHGGALVAEQVRVDDLDGDGAAERLLLGAVDAAHAADADQLEDHVAARQRGADQRIVGRLRDSSADREAAHRAELVRPARTGSRTAGRRPRHGRDTITDAPGEVGPCDPSRRAPHPFRAAPAGPPAGGRPGSGRARSSIAESWAVPEVGLTSALDVHAPPAPRPAPRRRAELISAAALDEVLAAQRPDGRRLGTLLVERGLINETQLTQILSHQLSVPWVSLLHIEFSRQLLNLVPHDVADRFCLVPIYVRHVRNQGDTLYVAMDDPSNEDGLEACREHSGLPVRAMIAPPSRHPQRHPRLLRRRGPRSPPRRLRHRIAPQRVPQPSTTALSPALPSEPVRAAAACVSDHRRRGRSRPLRRAARLEEAPVIESHRDPGESQGGGAPAAPHRRNGSGAAEASAPCQIPPPKRARARAWSR